MIPVHGLISDAASSVRMNLPHNQWFKFMLGFRRQIAESAQVSPLRPLRGSSSSIIQRRNCLYGMRLPDSESGVHVGTLLCSQPTPASYTPMSLKWNGDPTELRIDSDLKGQPVALNSKHGSQLLIARVRERTTRPVSSRPNLTREARNTFSLRTTLAACARDSICN